MTAGDPVPTPLEANDPQRARALKAKIRDRMSDVRRHLLALRTGMAEFGDDFELDAFRSAYVADDNRHGRAGSRVCVDGGRQFPGFLRRIPGVD
jgi:hypothetical protein